MRIEGYGKSPAAARRDATGLVGKYVHSDGSETSIKHVSSCDTVRDPNTGLVHPNGAARNKFSVFASSSRGCFMRCGMCHLTVKQASYGRVADPVGNIKEAMALERAARPEMSAKYMKLCWMGMGEDHAMRPDAFLGATLPLVRWAVESGRAAGVDGCDVSSVLPRGFARGLKDVLARLDEGLSALPVNPVLESVHSSNGYAGRKRSLARLFYSLHSASQAARDALIPNATPLADALAYLKGFDDSRADVVFHHLFLAGFNDSLADVGDLVALLRSHGLEGREFRVLRYNPAQAADGSVPYRETDARRFDECVAALAAALPRVKVQISTGTDVLAACGQFVATCRTAA